MVRGWVWEFSLAGSDLGHSATLLWPHFTNLGEKGLRVAGQSVAPYIPEGPLTSGLHGEKFACTSLNTSQVGQHTVLHFFLFAIRPETVTDMLVGHFAIVTFRRCEDA